MERVVAYPKFEQSILTLQWHKGFLGMRRGFDEKMMKQIEDLSSHGFELKAASDQADPTWLTLFFRRQVESVT